MYVIIHMKINWQIWYIFSIHNLIIYLSKKIRIFCLLSQKIFTLKVLVHRCISVKQWVKMYPVLGFEIYSKKAEKNLCRNKLFHTFNNPTFKYIVCYIMAIDIVHGFVQLFTKLIFDFTWFKCPKKQDTAMNQKYYNYQKLVKN